MFLLAPTGALYVVVCFYILGAVHNVDSTYYVSRRRKGLSQKLTISDKGERGKIKSISSSLGSTFKKKVMRKNKNSRPAETDQYTAF